MSKQQITIALSLLISIIWGGWWAVHKAYAIDEFYYVHEAWQMLQQGHGLLEPVLAGVRFLPLYFFAPIIWLAQDQPERMVWLRFEAILVWAVMLILLVRCAYILSNKKALAALSTLFFAVAARPLLWYAVELRPDPLAMTLTLASIWALLEAEHSVHSKRWAASAGLLLFMACCASFKAFVYGSPFAIAALCALPKRYRAHFTHPIIFSLVFGAGWVLTAIIVLGAGRGEDYWQGFFGLIQMHEKYYPKLDPWRLFTPMIQRYPWLVLISLLGLTELGRTWVVNLKQRQGSPALLILLVWVGAIASYFMQRGAYDYSLLPMLAMSCLVGGVGLSALWRDMSASISQLETSRRLTLQLTLGMFLALWCYDIYRDAQDLPSNKGQIEAHRTLGELTNAKDSIYDLSAAYVFRPRPHRFAFVDRLRAHVYAQELNEQVPNLLKEKQVPLFIEDARFHTVYQRPLGRFIQNHYQPYDGDFRIWGKRWDSINQPWQDQFWAIKDGEYFVHPPEVIENGRLEIDGEQVTNPIFSLKHGSHTVKWTPQALNNRQPLYILWLPRDKKRFDPTAKRPPKRLVPWVLPGGVLRER